MQKHLYTDLFPSSSLLKLSPVNTVMEGLKPFEDEIHIDSVPVIEYKSGTGGFLYSISVVQAAEWYFRHL